MNITFIICPNGLGHFTRSIELINSLSKSQNMIMDVFCQRWQFELFFKNIETPKQVKWHFDKMEPGVSWSKNPEIYNDNRLISWVHRFQDEPILFNSDLVISDNLTGILEIRADTILMGSFLWSDILENAYPNNIYVNEFVLNERELLKVINPFMLCTKDIVMPNVLKYTQAIQLPWLSNRIEKPKRDILLKHKKIGLLIGKTDSLISWAKYTIPRFLAIINGKLALPEYLVQFVPEEQSHKIEIFNFSTRSFLTCDVILCRPGVGTLNRCIETNTPIITMYEKNNIEMVHNGARIELLGFGINIREEPLVEDIKASIDRILLTEDGNMYRNNINNAECGGLQHATDWINNKLSEKYGIIA